MFRSEQVTPEQLVIVLKNAQPKFKDFQVKHFQPIDEKNGLLSTIFKAEVEVTSIEDDSTRITWKLFIKTMPTDKECQDILIDGKNDITEVETFRQVFQDLRLFEEQKSGTSTIDAIVPKLYGGDYCLDEGNRGYYLILDDVTQSGYSMPLMTTGLTVKQVEKIMHKLADLHALSYCHSQAKGLNYRTHYNFMNNIYGELVQKETLYEYGLKHMRLYEEKLKGTANEYLIPKIFAYWARLDENMDLITQEEPQGQILTHTDLWLNNLMVNPDTDDTFFVDWQYLSSFSVFHDISLVIFTGLDPDILEDHFEPLLIAYYKHFQAHCSRYGITPPWSQSVFVERGSRLGTNIALCWVLLGTEFIGLFPGYEKRYLFMVKFALKRYPFLFGESP